MLREKLKRGAAHEFVIVALVIVGGFLFVALMFPATARSRSAALRNQSLNNLKNIAAAMLRYEQDDGHLPPAVVTGQDGWTKHSWRVELLPYLGQQKLYQEYRFDEPWDSEHNIQLIDKMPEIYQSPGSDSIGMAAYFVPTGKGTLFAGEDGPNLNEIQDNPATTIMLVDAERDVPWTKPEDIVFDFEKADSLPSLGGPQTAVFLVGFADGTVDSFLSDIDAADVKKMLTIDGGEHVDVPDRRPFSP